MHFFSFSFVILLERSKILTVFDRPAYVPGQGVHIDHPAIVEILISQLDSQRKMHHLNTVI